ncbi:MAG: helicase C-terminal domain-containing protein [bacterium]|nr:helicase C-terminal domain-containing protein [bacterium]
MNETPGRIPFTAYMAAFPTDKYPVMRANQRLAFEHVAKHRQSILEIPTGEGKSAIEYTILKAAASAGKKPLFLVMHNLTVLQQMQREYPGLAGVVGRGEHNCFYYEDDEAALQLDMPLGSTQYRANEIACSLLKDCPHRVNLLTGMTHEEGAEPCPYLHFTHKALQAPIVLCTMAYYLFTQLFTKRWEKPVVLVIDEAHKMADVVRNCLSYDITDYHLKRAITLLERLGADESVVLTKFLKVFIKISKRKPAWKPTLLDEKEIIELIGQLEELKPASLEGKLLKAIKEGAIDVAKERETLKQIETLVRDINRYIHSFQYSLADTNRGPLNYTFAYRQDEREEGEGGRVQHRITVKSHYVAPLIRKILGHETVALSATIGDPGIFSLETGIDGEFSRLGSSFPAKNARIFVPLNTPSLAFNDRKPGDVKRWLRITAKGLKKLADLKIRSLVVVVSNDERDLFKQVAEEEALEVVTYGNGVTPRAAAADFCGGKGMTLLGTEANYCEGLDLHSGIAPVIIMWRVGYPSPDDPAAQFETRKFRNQRWKLWHWRVGIKAFQVRGRNIRGPEDLGVTIFVDQRFRGIVFPMLPKALKDFYDGGKQFDECIDISAKLVG